MQSSAHELAAAAARRLDQARQRGPDHHAHRARSPRGRVFSHAALLDKLHDDTRDAADRCADTHLKNLRRKLEQASPGEDPLRSIYGLGYRLDA